MTVNLQPSAAAILVNYRPLRKIKHKSPTCTTTSSIIVNGYYSETQERVVICDNNKGLFVEIVAKMTYSPDNGPEFSITSFLLLLKHGWHMQLLSLDVPVSEQAQHQ